MKDSSDSLLDAVLSAREQGHSVAITGSGSKTILAQTRSRDSRDRLLSTVEHTGIVDYRPAELVVTVRAGTPLKELAQTLAREGQMLGFEPPEFRGLGTVGGTVATGLAGAGRPWRGSVRDLGPGVGMINGLGERLSFGGQVMKNVAGFDVSRLQVAAYGMFGLLLDVSLKVLPIPHAEQTRRLQADPARAHALMLEWAAQPHPLTASAYINGALWLRLSGAETAVRQAGEQLGGELQPDNGFWQQLRDHSLPLFRNGPVACRHVPPAMPLAAADELLEWNAARRWSSDADAGDGYRPFAEDYARYRCRDAGGNPLIARYQARLKRAFDPDNLFNRELTDADVPA